jgi:hypothetical protein
MSEIKVRADAMEPGDVIISTTPGSVEVLTKPVLHDDGRVWFEGRELKFPKRPTGQHRVQPYWVLTVERVQSVDANASAAVPSAANNLGRQRLGQSKRPAVS